MGKYGTPSIPAYFMKLIEVWSDAVGSGDYMWKRFALADFTGSYPATKVTLNARGAVEVAVSNGLTGSAGAQLMGIGFSASSGTSTTTYYRKAFTFTPHWGS